MSDLTTNHDVPAVTLSRNELYLVAVSSLRYAMGRQTYVVGETIEFLKKYWNELEKGHQQVLHRDLEEEVKRACRPGASAENGPLGASFDKQAWIDFLNWIEERHGFQSRNG